MFNVKIAVLVVVALVGAVACQEQTPSSAEQGASQATSRSLESLRNGLLDLAFIGAKGAKRVAHESKPTLEGLKNTMTEEAEALGQRIRGNERLQGIWQSILSNKHVEQAVQGLKPLSKNAKEQLDKLAEQAKPLLDEAAAKAKPLLEQAEQKRKELLAEHEARQAKLRAGTQEPAAEQQE